MNLSTINYKDIPNNILVNKNYPIGYIAPNNLVNVSTRIKAKYVNPNYVLQLNEEASYSWEYLKKHVQNNGYDIDITSGYRSYEYQEQLIQHYLEVKKMQQDDVDKTVSLPGASEHQSGLALDFLVYLEKKWLDLSDEEKEKFLQLKKKTLAYVHRICKNYGFILRYPISPITNNPNDAHPITGIKYEPWHLRYVGMDIADKMTFYKIHTLEEYFKQADEEEQLVMLSLVNRQSA